MHAFPISDAIISQHATGESYARGDEYVRSGRVSALSVRDNVLSASVQGSEYAPYSVRVTEHDGVVTEATCTCLYSYGGWCKHIVAALIVAARQPDEVAERPSLAGRLDLLERDALQALVLRLVEHDPDVEAAVERLLPSVAGETADVAALVSVDPAAIKARVSASIHSLGGMRSYDAYRHVGSVARQAEQELEPARALLDAGRARSALDILRAVLDVWSEQWKWLDDSDGDASRVFYTAEPLLVEALLAVELSTDDRDWWEDHLDAWIAELSDYGTDVFYDAFIAVHSGWDAPELLAVLNGESDVLESPDDPMLEESSDLIAIRLKVLARNGQDAEALRLAAAAGHVDAYATALVRRGEAAEAERYTLERVTRPAEAHEIATAMHAAGMVAEALRVAERGIALSEPERGYLIAGDELGIPTRAALAIWLRGVAEQAGDSSLARQAAGVAVRDAPGLETWHEARRLACEDWLETRETLRKPLRSAPRGSSSGRVDIFLEEGWIEDAINAVRQGGGYALIARVADAAVADQPDWVIATSRSHAETIMDGGHSNAYGDAARWLARMKAASRAAGKEAEFRDYLAETIGKHNRKYKLVPLLRELQR